MRACIILCVTFVKDAAAAAAAKTQRKWERNGRHFTVTKKKKQLQSRWGK